MKLSDFNKGNTGVVLEIDSKELEVALMKLGLVSGDQFILTDRAPFGGPIALQVNGHKVALRRRDAAMVTVKSLV